jgi:hypothetical protein
MAKPKRKLTPAQRKHRRDRRRNTQIVFMNGKQVRVAREPKIDGIPVSEFIARNADPIWLHQCGMWEYIDVEQPVAIEVEVVLELVCEEDDRNDAEFSAAWEALPRD